MDDIVNSLSIYAHTVRFFALGWPPGSRRDLGCYLYHSEKILTHPTPPGLTELEFACSFRIGVENMWLPSSGHSEVRIYACTHKVSAMWVHLGTSVPTMGSAVSDLALLTKLRTLCLHIQPDLTECPVEGSRMFPRPQIMFAYILTSQNVQLKVAACFLDPKCTR